MTRSGAQRCHDGIKLGARRPASPPRAWAPTAGTRSTVIVRTTLAELNQAAHAVTNPDMPMPAPARTGGDTALPMRDLIRMGADGIHYLAVFDDHSERPLYLGRQHRIATPTNASIATPKTVKVTYWLRDHRPRRHLHPHLR